MLLRTIPIAVLALACSRDRGFDTPPNSQDTGAELPMKCIFVEPSVVEFGDAQVGDEEGPLLTYAVGNRCTTDLVVRSIEFDQPDPPFVLEPPLGGQLRLRANESRAFGVRFEPRLYLDVSARIRVKSNDVELPEEVIALKGTGICADGQTDDADEDLVPDLCDACPGGDDRLDYDQDGVPDDCDYCPYVHDSIDYDHDGVADPCDYCDGDDTIDSDGDGNPDDCDICDQGPDDLDEDLDFVPDACDACPGFNDFLDTDLDGVPNGCDACQGFHDLLDTDGDTVPDGCDECPGFDDRIDSDGDGVPDACDAMP